MTDHKNCPFMSRYNLSYVNDDGMTKFVFTPVRCSGSDCMAWGEVQTGNGKGCRLIP